MYIYFYYCILKAFCIPFTVLVLLYQTRMAFLVWYTFGVFFSLPIHLNICCILCIMFINMLQSNKHICIVLRSGDLNHLAKHSDEATDPH